MPMEFLGDPRSPLTYYLLGVRRSLGEGANVVTPFHICGRSLNCHVDGSLRSTLVVRSKQRTRIHTTPSMLLTYTRWIFPVNLNITRGLLDTSMPGEFQRKGKEHRKKNTTPASILISRRSKQTGHITWSTADPKTDI